MRGERYSFLNAQEVVGDPALFYDQMPVNEAGQRHFARELTSWLLPLLGEGAVSPS